jgi:hypothetical protein
LSAEIVTPPKILFFFESGHFGLCSKCADVDYIVNCVASHLSRKKFGRKVRKSLPEDDVHGRFDSLEVKGLCSFVREAKPPEVRGRISSQGLLGNSLSLYRATYIATLLLIFFISIEKLVTLLQEF